jgi:hypothetical protein
MSVSDLPQEEFVDFTAANDDRIIIGISGKAGHGKDTVAEFIRERYLAKFLDREIKIIGFADKLKEVISTLTGVNIQTLHDPAGKKLKCDILSSKNDPVTYRESMLRIGKAIRETFHKDIWIKLALDDPNMLYKKLIIVKDVRFLNEAEAIKDRGGILIRVTRPGVETGNDPSETQLDDYKGFDNDITNDSSLEELRRRTITCLEELEESGGL